MDLEELVAEASWVADRLREGRRVLVHCYAGVNRSATVCCAALILLEGLSAEDALWRVRERHPVAWPDPYYWLLLRWLARDPAAMAAAHTAAADTTTPVPAPLRP
jgi:protein-tyrosine phosphatase